MHLNATFILASASPRRKFLLDMLGLSFRVQPSDVEEIVDPDLAPADLVQRLALQKTQAVAARYPEALTLGADTIVVLDGAVLGKPTDPEDAIAMLRMLSGREHTVYTGLALAHPATARTVMAYEATQVTFAYLTDREIQAYVATGSPMDKAGAYGIQDDLGALFIQRIDGDYYNVVGLPLHRLYRVLSASFDDLFSLVPSTTT